MKKFIIIILASILLLTNISYAQNDIYTQLDVEHQKDIIFKYDVSKSKLNETDSKILDLLTTKFSNSFGLTGNPLSDNSKIVLIINRIENLLRTKLADRGKTYESLSKSSKQTVLLLNVYIQQLKASISAENIQKPLSSSNNSVQVGISGNQNTSSWPNYDLSKYILFTSYNINDRLIYSCVKFTDNSNVKCYPSDSERISGIKKYQEDYAMEKNKIEKMLSDSNAKDMYKGIPYDKNGRISFSKSVSIRHNGLEYTTSKIDCDFKTKILGMSCIVPYKITIEAVKKLDIRVKDYFKSLNLGGSMSYSQNLGSQSIGVDAENLAFHRFYASEGGKAQIKEIIYTFDEDVVYYKEVYTNGNSLSIGGNPFMVKEGYIGYKFGRGEDSTGVSSTSTDFNTIFDSRVAGQLLDLRLGTMHVPSIYSNNEFYYFFSRK